MTNVIEVICRNTLTGQTSEFGNINNREIKAKLIASLDSSSSDGLDGIYKFYFDELIFVASNKITYTDSEGKKRTINYSKEDLKEYCDDLFHFLRKQTKDFIDYTHDIQYLIGALNAASVQKPNMQYDLDFYQSKLERINLISILVSAKSAFFRFLTEDIDNTEKDDVSITGKTFKIYKGISFLAQSKKKNADPTFNSNSKSTIRMVDIFEFIPYTIVENAIKYGPRDLDIDINIFEEKDDIRVCISSLGPQLSKEELTRIFERGYRGKYARDGGFPGHGLGLFQANKASDILFGGYIFAEQSDSLVNIGGIPYADTNFTIVVPK
jgi:hypothetical protein